MKKKQKKMITTGSVIFMIVLLLCIAYTGIYLNARKNAKRQMCDTMKQEIKCYMVV